MMTVVQRVRRAAVHVNGEVCGRIGPGLVLFVCVEQGDGDAEIDLSIRKLTNLRMFPGRTPMDKSVREVQGSLLVVSQFTLAASLNKGNRPSFERAETPERAQELYNRLVERLRSGGLEVQTGRFAAMMEVELTNDGPVTFVLACRAGSIVRLQEVS